MAREKDHGSSEQEFAVVEHTADWALWVQGADLAELLVNAARGMNSLLVADVKAVAPVERRLLRLEAFDQESMLVEWLSELAYLAERERFIGREFDVQQASAERLEVVVRGGRARSLQKHIKAVTYHNLAVLDTGTGLETTVVFDV